MDEYAGLAIGLSVSALLLSIFSVWLAHHLHHKSAARVDFHVSFYHPLTGNTFPFNPTSAFDVVVKNRGNSEAEISYFGFCSYSNWFDELLDRPEYIFYEVAPSCIVIDEYSKKRPLKLRISSGGSVHLHHPLMYKSKNPDKSVIVPEVAFLESISRLYFRIETPSHSPRRRKVNKYFSDKFFPNDDLIESLNKYLT